MEIYYFGANGEKVGPVSKEELTRLAGTGAVNEQTVFVVNGREVLGRHIKNLRPIFDARNKPLPPVNSDDKERPTTPPPINNTGDDLEDGKTFPVGDSETVSADNTVFSGMEDDYRNEFVKKYQKLKDEPQPRPHAKLWGCLIVTFLMNVVLVAGVSVLAFAYFKGEKLKRAETEAKKIEMESFARGQADLRSELGGRVDEGTKSIEDLNNLYRDIERRVSDVEQSVSDVAQDFTDRVEQITGEVSDKDYSSKVEAYDNIVDEIDRCVTQIVHLCSEIELLSKNIDYRFDELRSYRYSYENYERLREAKNRIPSYATIEEHARRTQLEEQIDRMEGEERKLREERDQMMIDLKQKIMEKDRLADTCIRLAGQAMNLGFDGASLAKLAEQKADEIAERTSELAEKFPKDEKLQSLNETIQRFRGHRNF
ncbi:MAG: DUF4339 domain-containing protein [Thermoguttaceae bacterium]|nr:DUF4339 domain-containing protein [Thermoguttaceae bacterium]